MTSRFLDRSTPPHLLTLILLSGISALNMTIYLPSLAHMAGYFGTSYGVIQLSVPLYLAATTVVQIFAGPLSDRFGRRPVLLGALAIFALASLGCALAPSVEIFLICRVVQSAVATAMVLSRAIVRDMYDDTQAAAMLSYVIMFMSIVPMVGPMLGGLLDETLGWQASFVLLTLCGLGMIALIQFDMAETSPTGETSVAELFRTAPELLRAQRFWAYVLTAGFTSGIYFALLGGASHVAGEVFGLSPKAAGFALGAPAIGYLIGNGLSGHYTPRVGLDRMILIGACLTVMPMALSWGLGLAGISNATLFFGLCTWLGFGNGLVMPNAMAGMLSVRPRLAGTASGLGGAVQIGAGALLSALAGFLLEGAPTALPLQAVMLGCALGALLTAVWAWRRNRQLALRG